MVANNVIPISIAVSQQSTSVLEIIYSSIPWDVILVTYIFIFIDLFYGTVVSTIKKETVSHKMLKGLKHKIFVLFVPVIAIVLKAFFVVCSIPSEWAGSSTLTSIFGVSQLSEFPICFLLCLFVILMEFLSFLETSAKIDKRANNMLRLIQKKTDEHKDVKHLISEDDTVPEK